MSLVLKDLTGTIEDVNKHKKFSHYAESTSVTEGYILGTPVLAICGEVFIPSRDPNQFILCPKCKKIADALFIGT